MLPQRTKLPSNSNLPGSIIETVERVAKPSPEDVRSESMDVDKSESAMAAEALFRRMEIVPGAARVQLLEPVT